MLLVSEKRDRAILPKSNSQYPNFPRNSMSPHVPSDFMKTKDYSSHTVKGGSVSTPAGTVYASN